MERKDFFKAAGIAVLATAIGASSKAKAAGFSIDSGQIDTNGATNGTLSHLAIVESSIILMSLQRDVNEDISPLFCTLIGSPRAGEQDWEINQGHDNPVYLNYVIINS